MLVGTAKQTTSKQNNRMRRDGSALYKNISQFWAQNRNGSSDAGGPFAGSESLCIALVKLKHKNRCVERRTSLRNPLQIMQTRRHNLEPLHIRRQGIMHRCIPWHWERKQHVLMRRWLQDLKVSICSLDFLENAGLLWTCSREVEFNAPPVVNLVPPAVPPGSVARHHAAAIHDS